MTEALETSVNPLTGEPVHSVAVSTQADVDAVVAAAAVAAPAVAAAAPGERAHWLDRAAVAVERQAAELAALAGRETGLDSIRLDGEVARCAAQLRFYAEVAREGGFLDVVIDHAAGDRPDLRRMRVPVGPVAVFGASNFPFAFGSVGNDTASALAAGCPVVVKGHPAHLGTHTWLIGLVAGALAEAGAPPGSLGAVTGFAAGTALVVHPGVGAVAFTGSQAGGMALLAAAGTRAVPIPVFAEMGSLNPVVVTRAGAESAEAVAAGCVGSFTVGMGQFCTKPGLVLVPAGSGLAPQIVKALERSAPRGPLLSDAIAGSYAVGVERLLLAGADMAGHVTDPGPGSCVSAVVLTADADLLRRGSPLVQECFGPVLIVTEYADEGERDAVLGRLQGCLVGSILSGGAHDRELGRLVRVLSGLAGRVTVDQWPTGVATTWAQHHGGPWPSTTIASATSVGSAALNRFSRVVTLQNVPRQVLPPALTDENPWQLPRRVDGTLQHD